MAQGESPWPGEGGPAPVVTPRWAGTS